MTIKANLITEWNHFRNPKIFFGIVFGAIAQFIHNVCHNYVYYLAGEYEVYGGPDNQLTDLGFKALPSIADMSFLPSNGCLYSLGVIAVIVATTPIFTVRFFRTDSIRTVQILWRAMVVCSVAIVFRCVSFLVTILPAPAPQCAEAEFSPPDSTSEIFLKFDTDNGCSDLIFSSHMMYGLIATGIVTDYTMMSLKGQTEAVSILERWLKYCLIFTCVGLVIAEAFCIVAQNRHYTVDVWTSCYAVPLTWIAFRYFIPNDPGPYKQTNKQLCEVVDESTQLNSVV
jgi:hypothetical protein